MIKTNFDEIGGVASLENVTPKHRDFGLKYEEVQSRNARGQTRTIEYANGVRQTRSYRDANGWLSGISISKANSSINSLGYTYDNIGNLKTRNHTFQGLPVGHSFSEEFEYDSLNRLKLVTTTPNGLSSFSTEFNYDGFGNFTEKGDVGFYKYHSSKKNQLAEIWSDADFSETKLNQFVYDGRGNVTSDAERTFKYTAFDKPYEITKNQTVVNFWYGVDKELYKQTQREGSLTKESLYLGIYERTKFELGVIEHKYFVGNTVVTDRSNNDNDTLYLHKDNLGSTVSVSDKSGVVQHMVYDAWCVQRTFDVTNALANYSSPGESDGYTGHKMINSVGIIHMKGRIYDQKLGRFLQADPHIQAPKNSQNYNRYSYVLNNPLSYTDPSGYFFKKLWKGVGKLWQATTGSVFRAIANVPILNSIAQAAACFYGGPWGCAAYASASTYAVTGSLKAAFTSGAIAAATAYAFSEIGAHFKGLDGSGSINFGGNMLTSGQVAQQITAHALVGGVSSSLQGGKFGHGFFSAGVTKGLGGAFLAGGDNLSTGEIVQGAVVSAVIGGTASKISGGKFANGAQTGAFQYLFNQAEKKLTKPQQVLEKFANEGAKYKNFQDAQQLLRHMDIEEFQKLFPYLELPETVLKLQAFNLQNQLNTDVTWGKNGGLETAMKSAVVVAQGGSGGFMGAVKRFLGFTVSQQPKFDIQPRTILKEYGDAYFEN